MLGKKTLHCDFLGQPRGVKRIDSAQLNSRLVSDCVNTLNELSNYRRVALTWISGVTQDTKPMKNSMSLPEQAHSWHLQARTPAVVKTTTKEGIENEFKSWWQHTLSQTHAKEFMKEALPKFTEDLSKDSLLTRYCKLNKYMNIMGLTEEAIYRVCQHILCKCDG